MYPLTVEKLQLQVINRNSSQTENTLHYGTRETVSDVHDMIRAQCRLGPDVQIILFSINGLDQNTQQAELQGDEQMRKYFPKGGQVYLETRDNPSNSKQGQSDVKIRCNRATDEAQQRNIIAVQSEKVEAEVVDNTACNKAKQSNLVTDGRFNGAELVSMITF